MSAAPVASLCVGRAAIIAGGKRSAIAKHPVMGPVRIGILGLEGDTQVNRKYHGGPEMAVHLYPLAHHAFWRERLGDHPLLAEPGAFGSNIALDGLDETMVRIGERFQLGTAMLEVSQPRMPCATIERRFARQGMVEAILASGRCGWYLRVVEEGTAAAGDAMQAVPASGTRHTVRSVFRTLAVRSASGDPGLVEELAGCAALSPEWRAKAAARLRQEAR